MSDLIVNVAFVTFSDMKGRPRLFPTGTQAGGLFEVSPGLCPCCVGGLCGPDMGSGASRIILGELRWLALARPAATDDDHCDPLPAA